MAALCLGYVSLHDSPTLVAAQPAASTEPTKAADKPRVPPVDAATEAKFQQWKAGLPPQQQAWEETLEKCLGSFYLPGYKRAKVAGTRTAWDYVHDDPKLPRVLLIGDSISRGYTEAVQKELAGKVNVHRAPANCGSTASGLTNLDIWLGDGRWDLIHFNFGIHDRRTPPDEYRQRLQQIIQRLRKTGAHLVWAATTPVAERVKDVNNAALVERNAIAAEVMQKHKIPVDDLYNLILPDLEKYQNPTDCHFSGAGYNLLGAGVARCILAELQKLGPTRPDKNAALNTEPDAFSLVVLPDTQFYSEKFPETYLAQMRWIKDNVQRENIRFVIHLGDIVQNPTEEPEWQNADRAHRILDGVVPYSVAAGNHDLGLVKKSTVRDAALFNKYFPPSRFANAKWYGGHMGATNENSFCFFDAAGQKFMVLSLEYAPRDEALDWAAKVLAAHPQHHAILATHCYMRPTARDAKCGAGGVGNSGDQVWEKLVRKQPSIFLVLSGHVLGVGRQTSTNDAGRPVHETLVDYQGLENGGNGWLRVMRFLPRAGKIEVRAYSPLLDETNPDDAHTFTLDCPMISVPLKGLSQNHRSHAERPSSTELPTGSGTGSKKAA